MNKIFSGIGSRKTPQDILDKFFKIGAYLARKGYILRSGGADSADATFEAGCDSENGAKEIYLPWKGFNNNDSELYNIPIGAFLIAKSIHPAWDKLSNGAKKLHARNVGQLISFDFDTPSDFVVCWTENGEAKGGSATVINLAKELNIPVFNYGSDGEARLREYFKK
jgi:hypothetical protein